MDILHPVYQCIIADPQLSSFPSFSFLHYSFGYDKLLKPTFSVKVCKVSSLKRSNKMAPSSQVLKKTKENNCQEVVVKLVVKDKFSILSVTSIIVLLYMSFKKFKSAVYLIVGVSASTNC